MKPTPEQTHELATITLHPGWDTLRKLVEGLPENMARSLSGRMMRGDIPSEADIHYFRGYAAAVRDVLSSPVKAVNTVNRLARGEQVEE